MTTSSEPAGLESDSQAGLAGRIAGHRSLRRATFYPKTDSPLPDALLRSLRDAGPPEDLRPLADLCRVHLGEGPTRLEPLDHQGTFHQLFRAELASGDRWIIRTNRLVASCRDLDLHVDAWAYRRLHETGLASLRIAVVDSSRERVGFDYEIMEEARGDSLRIFDEADAEMLPRLADLGRFLARVHAIPTEGYGWIDPGPLVLGLSDKVAGLFDRWGDYLRLRLNDHVRACVDAAILDEGAAKDVERCLRDVGSREDGFSPSLLHGDLGNHNVFHERDRGITAVIDWEDCLSGDPVFDLAFWATFHPERRWSCFLDAYWSATETTRPVDFERRFWLYYLRIALSKTVHRQRFGYSDRPGRPPASSRIDRALRELC